ncbi:MAG: hypothetical protein ACOYI2_04415 [Bacillota bacterium]|jgi:hypothetical protein|nr:hypothetical protein [Clostridia bacterium]
MTEAREAKNLNTLHRFLSFKAERCMIKKWAQALKEQDRRLFERSEFAPIPFRSEKT